VRSVVYRYDDLPRLLDALDAANGQMLPLPAGVIVRDGEWVLALFEFEESSRATAAAGKGVLLDEGSALVFERRDWERLHQFASARAEARVPEVSGVQPAAAAPAAVVPPAPAEPPAERSLRSTRSGLASDPPIRITDPGLASLRRTASWERVPTPPPLRPSEQERTTDEGPPPVHVPSAAPPHDPDDAPMTVRQPLRLRGEGSRVLLVDDDPDLRDVVGAMLEAVGLFVVPAASAEEALELARGDAPDLVVLDWNLPAMSGLEMLKVVRADSLLAGMPIMFLTAHSATQDMVEAFAAGADDYLVKPFRAAELGARIFGLLRRMRAMAGRR